MSNTFSQVQQDYMQLALQKARESQTIADPNPHVGCVLVKNRQIIGTGATQRVGEAHAEIMALHEAGAASGGAEAYVTLEPCAHQGRTGPCVDALISAKVKRVIIACEDPNPKVAGKSIEKLKAAGIETQVGLFADQAKLLNRGFMQRMRTGKPFVTAKMGVSVDGRSAIADGNSNWISSLDSRQHAHQYRAKMSAILTTAKTVLADDPRLTARNGDELFERQPLRIVLDPNAQVSPQAKLFQQAGNSLLFVREENLVETGRNFYEHKNLEVAALPVTNNHFDLKVLMQELGQRDINNLLLEAGADFQGACISAGIVNELRVYLAPMLLGQSEYGILQLPALKNMQERKTLNLHDIQRIADDVLLTYHFQQQILQS